jgi:16S rRNA (uracil1498-N3)-methyltransferase
MPKLRRFRTDSLKDKEPGAVVTLPESEAAHIRVLRLEADVEIELFDDTGRSAKGRLIDGNKPQVHIDSIAESKIKSAQLILATAWPKGKRAAIMVEKCAELGLDVLIPIRYSRSVVSKDEEAEGLQRLRRIAVEAAKQCGRNEPLQIAPEQNFAELVTQAASGSQKLLLDPTATASLAQTLLDQRDKLKACDLLLFVGPEGGFSTEELALADRFQIERVKLARHVLRIETAAMAACAITGAVLRSGS